MSPELQRILESKQAYRAKLAQKPIAEKLRIVEELAERTLALRKDTSSMLPEEPWPIPKGWRWARMGDVATIVGGGTPRTDREEYFGGDVPWITPADLSGYKEKMISRGARNISQEGLANSGARLLPAKTILFSSRAPIGYVAIAENPVATNQGFKSFILGNELLPEYVYYYLQRAKELAVALASGTTFLEISGKNAARLPIPIPPLPEQRRIVGEIEKQFSRLEEGVGALRRVQANLKRYRAAVLKAACEGQLVPTEAELAKAKKRKFETGEELLARILAERRKNGHGRGKYKEPAAPDTSMLGKLPEGWAWANGGQLFSWSSGEGLTQKGINKGEYPVYGGNGVTGYHNAYVFEKPTIVIGRVGALCGNVYLTNGPAWITDNAIYANQVPSGVVMTFIRLAFTRAELNKRAAGSGQPFVNQRMLNETLIGLPPLAEQSRIVAEVERRLSVVEEMEATVEANLQRATRLRQSILQKAFTGALL